MVSGGERTRASARPRCWELVWLGIGWLRLRKPPGAPFPGSGLAWAHMSLGDAISRFAILSCGLVFVVALVIRETKGLAFRTASAT